jgi:hypothetical protein
MRPGSREHGLKYQQLVHGLNIAGEFAPSPLLYATWSWANACCAFIYAAANMALLLIIAAFIVGSAVQTPLSDPCADVKLDRKSLSELAKNEPLSFQQIVAVAKSALASNFDKSSQNASKEAQ